MKTLFPKAILSAFFATLILGGAIAQATSEFEVKVDQTEVSIEKGSSAEIQIILERSKRYSKTKIQLSMDGPEGLEIAFEPQNTTEKNVKATLRASGTLASGTYNVVVKGEGNNVSRGRMIQITVK